MAVLLYSSGLRLMECVRLRIKDIDCTRHEALAREGKGANDRVMIARALCFVSDSFAGARLRPRSLAAQSNLAHHWGMRPRRIRSAGRLGCSCPSDAEL